jgi:hypothetical protein
VLLAISKLTLPKIGLALVISTSTTKKIIEEASKRGGIKLLPEDVKICSRPNPQAPKNPEGRRYFFPPPHHRHCPNPT